MRWRQLAAESEELFARHRQNISAPGGTDWVGDARDVALDRVTTDANVVRKQGDIQREAADIAENGCRDIRAAQFQALEAINEAEEAGFRVAENLAVTDRRRMDVYTMAARYTAARDFAEDVRWHAERLVHADAYIAQRLQAKAAELGEVRFGGDSIQA